MQDSNARDAASTAETQTEELPQGFDRRHTTRARPYTFFEPPAAVKRLFAKFPLRTEPAERRPLSSLAPTKAEQTLHLDLWLRTTSDDPNTPSFDVDCLRYQTYLLARGINFGVKRAQPDGAPDGKLPFMTAIPPANHKSKRTTLIRRKEIETFVTLREKKNGVTPLSTGEKVGEQLGISLVEQQIRPAWLYAVYSRDDNFKAVTSKFYVEPVTSSIIARAALSHEIRATAKKDLNRFVSSPELLLASRSDENAQQLSGRLNGRANKAMDALFELLGDRKFFSGRDMPGYLDAALFAYTHLLFSHEFGIFLNEKSKDIVGYGSTLAKAREHEQAVYAYCFGELK